MSNFKLTILGSGTMMPTVERNPAGFLAEAGDKRILLDCGLGTVRRMVDYGFNPQRVDCVFISHFHTDHFGDAFNLVHARFVDDSYKKQPNKKLVFVGPKGTQKRYKLWRKIFWMEKGERYPLEFLEGERELKIGDIEIETFEVKHVKWFQNIAIVVNYQGRKIVYTGDIGSQNDINYLVQKSQDADLLITEASYTEPTPNHYTIGQVEELSKLAKVKKVLVVHLRPQHLSTVQAACRENQNWILGADGKVLEI